MPLRAEPTVTEFNSHAVFGEVGRTIRLHVPKRLGRTIRRRGPNQSWADFAQDFGDIQSFMFYLRDGASYLSGACCSKLSYYRDVNTNVEKPG